VDYLCCSGLCITSMSEAMRLRDFKFSAFHSTASTVIGRSLSEKASRSESNTR